MVGGGQENVAADVCNPNSIAGDFKHLFGRHRTTEMKGRYTETYQPDSIRKEEAAFNW